MTPVHVDHPLFAIDAEAKAATIAALREGLAGEAGLQYFDIERTLRHATREAFV